MENRWKREFYDFTAEGRGNQNSGDEFIVDYFPLAFGKAVFSESEPQRISISDTTVREAATESDRMSQIFLSNLSQVKNDPS